MFCDVPNAGYFGDAGVTGVLVWAPLLLDREQSALTVTKGAWVPSTPLSRLVAQHVARRSAKPRFSDDNGPQCIELQDFPHAYYLLLDNDDCQPSWTRACDVPSYFCLIEESGNDDGVPTAVNVEAELQAGYARVRARREWVWRSTQSLVWHALSRPLGLPRDVRRVRLLLVIIVCTTDTKCDSNLIAQWTLRLPSDEELAVEPYCEDCGYYDGVDGHDGNNQPVVAECEVCHRPICFDNAACTIPGHGATHRHVSRMAGPPPDVDEGSADDLDDDDLDDDE